MDAVLGKALSIGADRVINVASHADLLAAYAANKGYFDVQFEASGNERALRAGLEVLRPRSVLVQLGLGGDISVPQNTIVAKEIEMKGTFRFHEEFGLAVDLINKSRVDLRPLLTEIFPLDDAISAFEAAGDRSRSLKVQLAFRRGPAKDQMRGRAATYHSAEVGAASLFLSATELNVGPGLR